MWSSLTHSVNLYGRVPTGFSLGSAELTAFSLTMSPIAASVARTAPYGCERWKRTRCGSRTSVSFQADTKMPFACSGRRSKVNLTSFAVKGSPLWKTALSTSSRVQVLSSSCVHFDARPGNELEVGVDVDQLVEDVLVDLHRGVELGVGGVHVHRLVDGGQDGPAAADRLSGGGCRGRLLVVPAASREQRAEAARRREDAEPSRALNERRRSIPRSSVISPPWRRSRPRGRTRA